MNNQLRFHFAAVSDPGIKKEVNEDSIMVLNAESSRGEVLMAIVCDGMGGRQKGELSSAYMVDSMKKWFYGKLPALLAMNDYVYKIQASLKGTIQQHSLNLYNYGEKNGIEVGTTLTLLLIVNDQFFGSHTGDSRLYRITPIKGVNQLSMDHSMVAELVRMGRLTKEEAKRHPRRNYLTRAIGVSDFVEPEEYYGYITAGEGFLLCSDGFVHETNDEEYMEFLKCNDDAELTDKARNMVEQIKEKGETDNISVIVIKGVDKNAK